jgi:hypothetical protein
MKYGRKPARFSAASFQRSHVMRSALAALGAPPATSPDWVSAVMKQSPGGWLMDGNDNYGDCVIADCAHQEMLRTANVGTIWIPTQLEVLALYAYFQGYTGDPANQSAIEAYLAENDMGCNELTVINYLTRSGWLTRKLDGHANLDPKQLEQIKWTVCIFGASRLGLNLPTTAVEQFNKGEPWAPVAGARFGGGHDVPVVKYDGDYFYVVTWGQIQPVTPAFLAAKYADGTPYLEEAHAELALDWVNQAGTCPAKLDLAQLQAELSLIAEPPTPAPAPSPAPSPTPAPPPSPNPPMSKGEFYRLVFAANHHDYNDHAVTVEQAAADIAGICQMVTG